jgi:hypothetical protein
VQFQTGEMPKTKVLWSPRVGINWDVASNQQTQIRGGTGLFSGRPAYVWISNQIGNTGVLLGETRIVAPTSAFPFTPDPSKYRGAATGGPATSYALNVTDPDFKFPQVWRSNIALDHRLPGGLVSTTEYLYAKDVNAVYYIDSNLPAPQSAFTGVDPRPRWVGTACSGAGNVGGCVTRINATPGNLVTNAYVLKNTDVGSQWSIAQSLNKTFDFGLSVRGAYSYGRSYSLSDPESTAATSFSRHSHFSNPNTPGVGYSMWSPGHRVFALVSYRKEWLSIGTTGISAYWEARPSTFTASTRVSYVFGGLSLSLPLFLFLSFSSSLSLRLFLLLFPPSSFPPLFPFIPPFPLFLPFLSFLSLLSLPLSSPSPLSLSPLLLPLLPKKSKIYVLKRRSG